MSKPYTRSLARGANLIGTNLFAEGPDGLAVGKLMVIRNITIVGTPTLQINASVTIPTGSDWINLVNLQWQSGTPDGRVGGTTLQFPPRTSFRQLQAQINWNGTVVVSNEPIEATANYLKLTSQTSPVWFTCSGWLLTP